MFSVHTKYFHELEKTILSKLKVKLARTGGDNYVSKKYLDCKKHFGNSSSLGERCTGRIPQSYSYKPGLAFVTTYIESI